MQRMKLWMMAAKALVGALAVILLRLKELVVEVHVVLASPPTSLLMPSSTTSRARIQPPAGQTSSS